MAEHATFHEPIEWLTPESIERHRAIVSLMEELEAVDWYDQRVDATKDDALREVLAHNRDEEKEHAAMTLEWLRRHDPGWDAVLRTYLFTDLPIIEVEHEAEADDGGEGGDSADGSLAIGDLRREPSR
jgi:uncharacterized protein